MVEIASVSVEAMATGSSSTAITKPTGLSVGDLMVATVLSSRTVTAVTSPSGWTQIGGTDVFYGGNTHAALFYKYATSGDVAATDFTFSVSGLSNPQALGGVMYRITGAVDTDPLIQVNDGGVEVNQTTTEFTNTAVIQSEQSIVLFVAAQNDGTTNPTTSNYYVTGGDNPTFTERIEYLNTADEESISIADATYESNSAITAYGYDAPASIQNQQGFLFIIYSQQDATGTNTLTTTTSESFTQAGTCDGVTGNLLAESDSETFAQDGQATSPQQWTEPTRSSNDWTNKTL